MSSKLPPEDVARQLLHELDQALAESKRLSERIEALRKRLWDDARPAPRIERRKAPRDK